MYRILIFIAFISTVFVGCFPTQSRLYTPTSNSNNYTPSEYKLHPQFKVFHLSENKTRIFIKLFTQELKYNKSTSENIDIANLKISYLVTPSFLDKKLLDSATIKVNLKKAAGQTSIIVKIDLNGIAYKDHVVKLYIIDKGNTKKSTNYIRINRNIEDNSQFWLSRKKSNEKPIFKDYFNNKDTFIIQHTNTQLNKVFVKYYKVNFDVPSPPFYTLGDAGQDVTTDSSYVINKVDNKIIFNASKSGIYRILTDSTAKKGLTKIFFDNDYPGFNKSEQLAGPLQYLLSTDEYKKLMESSNLKLTLDNIWLKFAKNPEKARQLIKIWYNRAIFSNFYFTSFKEGWKTDRGMVYMVFGAPKSVKYSDNFEQWTYTEGKSYKPVYFIFVKDRYSISDNDYTLKRSITYRNFWYKAVNTWRTGQAYHSSK